MAPPILTPSFRKKEQNYRCQVTEIGLTLLMISVVYGQGQIQGTRMRDMHPPPAIFKNAFDVYTFSMISNLFDSNKPYALSTHNRKCANKMDHIWRSTKN